MGLTMVPIHTNEYPRPCVPLQHKDEDVPMVPHEYLCLSRPCIRLGHKDANGTYLWYVYI